MLEHVARRLIGAGCDRLIINVHHHAEKILHFLDDRDHFGVDVEVSFESERALETGGGLKKAQPLFKKDAPFFMHNSDIFTDLNLRGLYQAHTEEDRLATMAVRSAETSRYLLFDETEDLCGYSDRQGNEHLVRTPSGKTTRLDFCGVQVISPAIFDMMTESGVFSIMNTYLRLTKEGSRIRPHRVDDATWIDTGTPERLESARAMSDVVRQTSTV